ncbi:YadA family autotransporter adhesin, partial [Bergeriella denitrificans]
VDMAAGKNLTVAQENGKVTYALSDNISVDTVTATTVQVGGDTGPKIGADQEGNIAIGDTNGAPVRITNVAPGVNDTDAVNVGQLKAVNSRIDGVENRANAGVAQALATAGLPQAYLPGKSMMAIGGGVYRGETGYAIGYSSISDGGNWIIKGTASGNSRGNYGATAAVGYQW